MNTAKRFASVLLVGLVVTLWAGLASADDDPPGRAADIRYISGQVSIQPGGVDDWVGAAINRPLTTADRVWTDQESRTELHLGSSALRLSSETSLTLTNLDDEDVQVELDQGTLNLWVRHLYDGEIYEVDTPNLAFTVTRPGNYRFDVDPDGDTTLVTVRDGEGQATGDGPGVEIRSGQQVSFSNGQSLQAQFYDAPAFDGFDDWCRVRIDREAHSQSAQYVSPDVVGAADLDEYGTWRVVPGYGPVWAPTQVAAGWAPYHDGHWLWVEPWGWTWVDDAPWGFAPSHYGRWVYTGGYWGWTPGPMVVTARPVYAPALVAFVGGGGWGVGVSVGGGFGGGGGVGWFPLGYNEPYIPPYHVSQRYFTNVNVTNIHVTNVTVINNYYNNTTVINNIHYANRTQPGAFIAVSASSMSSGQSVRKVAVQVSAADIQRAPMAAAAPVAPVRNSVLGVHAGMKAAAPPAQAVQRAVVTKTAPPARPIPFAAKQDALARNPGRPLDAQSVQQIRAKLPPPPPPPAQNRGANNTVMPNNHMAPPRNNAPGNPNEAPRNPGTMNGNAGPVNASPDRSAGRPNGNPNSAQPMGNGNPQQSVPRPPNGNGNPAPPPRPMSPNQMPPASPNRDTQAPEQRQPRTPDSMDRNVPAPQKEATPAAQPPQRQPDNMNRSAPPRPPADNRPAAAPERQAAPPERTVPKPPAKPPKEEKEKPKDKDKDKDKDNK
ncbi:MAG: DUF6600 domain-containing protein [Terriglobales bacterium]